MAFYVNHRDCDTEYPSPGWYCITETAEGNEKIHGPYLTKQECLDVSTNGQHSMNVDYMREDAAERDSYYKSNGWD